MRSDVGQPKFMLIAGKNPLIANYSVFSEAVPTLDRCIFCVRIYFFLHRSCFLM